MKTTHDHPGKSKQEANENGLDKPQHKIDELNKEAEKERSKKPGSQSHSSKQHNNGRGGGK